MVLPMKRACPRRPRRPVITAPRLPQRLQPRSRRPSPSRPRSPRRLRSPRRPSRWRCAGSHPASQLYSNREGRPEARPAVGHGGAALPTTFSVAPAQEMEAALSYRATTVPLMSCTFSETFLFSRPVRIWKLNFSRSLRWPADAQAGAVGAQLLCGLCGAGRGARHGGAAEPAGPAYA